MRQGLGKRIFVGLSGGVDSAVSAALLKKDGHDVTGIFIKIWSPEWTECTSKDDRLDAMRVCAHLDIPFKEIDLTDQYKRDVVDYMLREYKRGRTPNPDVMCNRSIKFGTFLDWAIAEGADCIATGHYARIAERKAQNAERFLARNRTIPPRFTLYASRDASKDQSYFLWTLKQGELARTLFPIGNLKKTEVRALAKKFKLPNADKRDSQGLCFVGPVDVKRFLSRYIEPARGNVLDERGRVIGSHDGAAFLTIGERHGFSAAKKTSHDEPLYVVSKDAKRNTVTVGPRRAAAASRRTVALSDWNWISGEPPAEERRYEAQVRYHGKRFPCRVLRSGTQVEFLERPDAVAPGQSAVVFDGEVCLGGGVMDG